MKAGRVVLCSRAIISAVLTASLFGGWTPVALAQGPGGNGELQQKMAAMKQSAAENKQKLQQYQWIETRQITYKGEMKPQQVDRCYYGADGQVIRIPMGPQAQQEPSGGRLKRRMVEKKKDEMQDYMQQVKSLLSMYVPPNANLMQQAYDKRNVTMEKTMGTGNAQLVFSNYAKPGDKMTITFDPAIKKMTAINVDTYMDEPKDAVTLTINEASLPDGTNYPLRTVLDAKAKQIQVTTTNSGYTKVR
jgi:hypothetical protein